MAAHVETVQPARQQDEIRQGLRWKLAHTHPVVAFLLVAFAWSWLIWLAAIPLKDQDPLLVRALCLAGGYGPAVGGILALGLRNGLTLDLSRRRLVVLVPAAAVIFGLMALEYRAGKTLGFGMVAQQAVLTAPIVAAALFASLAGGWVISSARSSLDDIRGRMASLLPSGSKAGWILFALLFYPVMVLLSWGASMLLGLEIEYPALWGQPALETLPLVLLTFALTALAGGGLEEPG